MRDNISPEDPAEYGEELLELERRLRPYRFEPRAEHLRALKGQAATGSLDAARRPEPVGAFGARRGATPSGAVRASRIAVTFAAAAVVILAVVSVGLAVRQPETAWEVVNTGGAPRVASSVLSGTGSLPIGSWVETNGVSRALIKVGRIGEAEVEPNTRVRLLSGRITDHRLALDRGTIHARIWAPPRLFFVETPSAVAVDLGCAYTLTVDETGVGLLRVTSGWVAFDDGERESFVPAGARCVTRPGQGPGTPHHEDASVAFLTALETLDFGEGPPDGVVHERGALPGSSGRSAWPAAPARSPGREPVLATLLEEARAKDAITLWHLLLRVAPIERGPIHDRLARLAPPPAGVTREGVLAGDREMIDRWWDALGLGVTTWWRLWKSPGPPSLP